MVVAALLADIGTAAGMLLVCGMGALLVMRGIRKRDEDVDPDDL